MRHLNTIECQKIAGGNLSINREKLSLCTKKPTSDSVEEQLRACQEVIDSYEDINYKHSVMLQAISMIQNKIENIQLMQQFKNTFGNDEL